MNWAKENNKEFDVFVFLGTNTMNLKTANKVIKEYQAFLKKPVKYEFFSIYILITFIYTQQIYFIVSCYFLLMNLINYILFLGLLYVV